MSTSKRLLSLSLVFLWLSLMLIGCGGNDMQQAEVSADKDSEAQTQQEDTPQPTEEVVAETSDENPGLPADARDVVFASKDGIELEGRFYPARFSDSPLIVLMHWAPGDQDDWNAIAAWLQNREDEISIETGNSTDPWLDSTWFPTMLTTTSFNVFTFTFRNCKGGCARFEREKWYDDVKAAVDYSVGLDGIDPVRIIMIGASIGSDGAVDGCAYLNQKTPGACLGAMSLSPGNYLTIDYAEKVTAMSPIPVWCLYAEVDAESASICGNLDSENFTKYAYPATMVYSNGHGMNLIEQNQEPNPLNLMVDFLGDLTQ